MVGCSPAADNVPCVAPFRDVIHMLPAGFAPPWPPPWLCAAAEVDRLERAGRAACGPGRDDVMHGMYGKLDPRPEGQWSSLITRVQGSHTSQPALLVRGCHTECVKQHCRGVASGTELVIGSWKHWDDVCFLQFLFEHGAVRLMCWVLAYAGPRYSPEEVGRMQRRAIQEAREVGGVQAGSGGGGEQQRPGGAGRQLTCSLAWQSGAPRRHLAR